MPTYPSIPLMYHPTNVMLLDDDRKFLNDVTLVLDDCMPYVSNDDPRQIFTYLKSHTYRADALSALITEPVFDNISGPDTFTVNFSHLVDLLSPNRFKMSVVSLIDRQMKKIDGVEACRTIREDGFLSKLVLFTGKTSTEEAVQLFNAHVIDAFLVKESPAKKLAPKINETILACAWQQFVDLGESLTGLLSHLLKPLKDEQYINVFKREFQRNNTVEFYLSDSSCSFLHINAEGQAKHQFVRNEADFNDCYEIAKNNEAPYDVLQALRGRQQFPYTKKNMGYVDLQGDHWDNVMIPMDKVPGREWYYAMVDRPDVEVFSFKRYFNEVWPQP